MQLLKNGATSNDDKQIEVAPGTVVKVFDINTTDTPAAFLFLKLKNQDDQEVANNEYFLVTEKDTYDWSKSTWVNTPITHYASYAMLDSICTKNYELAVKQLSEEECEVTISNPTDKVAFMIRLAAKDEQGQLICPAYWSDNYLILAPGETRIVKLITPGNKNPRIE